MKLFLYLENIMSEVLVLKHLTLLIFEMKEFDIL